MSVCIVCEKYLDDSSQLTCKHPQCEKELREIYEEVKKLGCKNADALREYIKELKGRVSKLERRLGVGRK